MDETPKSPTDRREYKRVTATAIIEILPAGEDLPPEHVTAETLDMSQGGILFNSDHEFEVGSRWKLKLLLEDSQTLNADWKLKNFDGDEPVITAICSIVRRHGASEIGYEIAAKFESIDSKYAEEVQKFIDEM